MTNYKKEIQNEVKKGASRRGFLTASLAGVVTGAIGYTGVQKAGEYVLGVMQAREKDLKAGYLTAIEALGGNVRDFENSVTNLESTLQDSPEYQTIQPQETDQIEKLIENTQEFVDHYTLGERFHIAYDRAQLANKSISDKINTTYGKQQKKGISFLSKIDQYLNRAIGNKKTMAEIQENEETTYDRLSDLCKLYTINTDNLRSQEAVQDKLSDYIKDPKLQPEERQIYRDLLSAKPGTRQEIIENYTLKGTSLDIIRNMDSLTRQQEIVYDLARQDIEVLKELQDNHRAGITEKKEIRKLDLETYKVKATQIEAQLDSLTTNLEGIIKDVENRDNIDIKTRQEEIDEGFGIIKNRKSDNYVETTAQIVGGIGGIIVAEEFYRRGINKRRMNQSISIAAQERAKRIELEERINSQEVKPIGIEEVQQVIEVAKKEKFKSPLMFPKTGP
ncbi:MAG: hypothetical protein ACI83O_000262 [Patescibacteria group bacterium]|jgi:hypothetical protein